MSFWKGFEKAAESKEHPEGHHLRRFLLSNPVSSAIEAKKGKKLKAFGNAYGHQVVESVKGIGSGAGIGAGLAVLARGLSRGKMKMSPGEAAGAGALAGGSVGSLYGSVKGTHGAEASKIHGEYSKHK